MTLMSISFIDEWLVAEGTVSNRWYVVHTLYPRFVIEMCDCDDGGYESGQFEFYDECLDASLLARLSREAGVVFSQYVKDLEAQSQ